MTRRGEEAGRPQAGSAWLRDGRPATRGHDRAVEAIAAWGRDRVPHAILLVGPASIGKSTLARDVAAALLCTEDGSPAPCGACRACVRVASGNHPDLHLLRPSGPGGQVRIGGPTSPEPGVRELIADLALRPAEGSVRVAVIESAHRMNEDAQNALLRTLEEPSPGVVFLLCADDEDRLLPTIRSRCVRIRLGPVGPRAIEDLLADLGLADAPAAARLARLAEGRPGVAIALARHPDAVIAREELLRRLVDLADEGPAGRLVAGSGLLAAAREASRGTVTEGGTDETAPARRGTKGRGRSAKAAATSAGATEAAAVARPRPEGSPEVAEDGEDAAEDEAANGASGERKKAPPSERREAARRLIDAWRIVARDVAVAGAGGRRELREMALLEETVDLATRLPDGTMVTFLARLDKAEGLVERNANPELVVDTLLLAWPRALRPPASAAEIGSGADRGREDAG